MAEVEEILKERKTRYGEFIDNSAISQDLKHVIHENRGKLRSPDQREALDMICAKISRILTGDPNYADNWHDIAGYATLVANRLQNINTGDK